MAREVFVEVFDQLVFFTLDLLARGRRPVRTRLQRDERLQFIKPGRVGAVVGTADLRRGQVHLGILGQPLANIMRRARHLFHRHVDRKRPADDDVSLFELGHEFAAHERNKARRAENKDGKRGHRRPAVVEKQVELPHVQLLDSPHDEVVADRAQLSE